MRTVKHNADRAINYQVESFGKMSSVKNRSGRAYDLTQLIDLANLLQPKTEWPTPDHLDEIAGRIALAKQHPGREMDQYYEPAEVSLDAVLDTVWRAAAAKFPPSAKETKTQGARRGDMVILRSGDRLYPFRAPSALYRAAFTANTVLRAVAAAAAAAAKLPVNLSLPPDQPRFQVIPDGTVLASTDFYRDYLLAAITGFDGRRIRVCRECNILYMARRTDQTACSRRCANRYHQRQFRKDHPNYHLRAYRDARKHTLVTILDVSEMAEVA
jgi:hypothetical protein